MRLTPWTSSRGAGFDPLEVSEGVSLDPLVRSEGVPYPLKSFEGVWHPLSFPEGVYERNVTCDYHQNRRNFLRSRLRRSRKSTKHFLVWDAPKNMYS